MTFLLVPSSPGFSTLRTISFPQLVSCSLGDHYCCHRQHCTQPRACPSNREPSTARWKHWSGMKDVSFCFEKNSHVKKLKQQLFIRDQCCLLAVMAPRLAPHSGFFQRSLLALVSENFSCGVIQKKAIELSIKDYRLIKKIP